MEKKQQSFLKKLMRSKGFQLFVLTVVLGIIIYAINNKFIMQGNIRSVMIGMVVPGIMIVAVGPLLIGGGIDLSSSAQAAFGSMIFAQILSKNPTFPWVLALIVALACGAIFGLINVFLVNVLNFMPFIATIGMSSIYSGFTTMWTKSNNVMITRQSFVWFGTTTVVAGWVPILFIFTFLLVAAYAYMLSNTPFGRSAYMVGGNPFAARLAGLNPKKIRGILFVNSGIMCVLAGIAWSAQKKMASPANLITAAPNFGALTAVILGGVSFVGGSGGLLSGFIAMILLNIFNNGLIISGLPAFTTGIAQGLILIFALILDNISATRQRKALLAAAMQGVEDKKAKA